ncbi:MAG: MoaD/ThiS family protein [Cellvibrionales bacterium]|nr:MoaD/ThiS family protein [Cellvibrionales bacterium]
MINILFFGKLRESLGVSSLAIEPDAVTHAIDVKSAIYQMHPEWQALLDDPSTQIAINQTLVSLDAPVENGDEVAFFPPVTGG